MGFDDRELVVVLDEVVRQIIQIEARRSADPASRLQEWAAWLNGRAALFRDAAFREGLSLDSTQNALGISGAFEEFANDLLADDA
ncbi:MAG: hypothetical protein JWL86_633 [Rhizobium sp.]|nr:hypothetical protein [Rhizobium sp.]